LGVGKSKEQGAGNRGAGKKQGVRSREHGAEKDSFELRVPGFKICIKLLATYALRFIELQHGSTYC
jgi:hypothetical protein